MGNLMGQLGSAWDRGVFGQNSPYSQMLGPDLGNQMRGQMMVGLGAGLMGAPSMGEGLMNGMGAMQGTLANSIKQVAAMQEMKRAQEEAQRWQQLAQMGIDPSDPIAMARALAQTGSPDAARMAAQMSTSIYNTNTDRDMEMKRLGAEQSYRNQVLAQRKAEAASAGQGGAPTALLQNLQAAGIDPRSPEGQQIITRNLGGRGGPRMTVYGPDGKPVVQMGDPEGDSFDKAANNDIEKRIVDNALRMDRVRSIQGAFKPEYLQLPTQAGMWVDSMRDKSGGVLPPLAENERAALSDYAAFRSTAFNDMSQTLKEMSGAAVTPQEYERLLKSLGNPDVDAPEVFKSKMDSTMKQVKMAQARLYMLRSRGLPAGDIDKVPLESMDSQIDAEGDRKAAELRQMGVPEEQIQMMVRQHLNSVFGGQ